MIDCSRCEMCEPRCRDCAIAVTEARNVTGRLGRSELRALRVLADAGLVPKLAGVLPAQRLGARPAEALFPNQKVS